MGMHAAGRRRQVHAKGRPMVLRRRTAASGPATAVSVLCVVRGYAPEDITGNLQQGDATAAIMNDEIAAAAWPGPPRKSDELVVDGVVWVVQGNEPIYEGTELIGHKMVIRGGK